MLFRSPAPGVPAARGIAVWNGLVVAAATCDDELVVIDANRKHVVGKGDKLESIGEEVAVVPLASPCGLVFNAAGDLYAVSAGKLLHFAGAGRTLAQGKLP